MDRLLRVVPYSLGWVNMRLDAQTIGTVGNGCERASGDESRHDRHYEKDQPPRVPRFGFSVKGKWIHLDDSYTPQEAGLYPRTEHHIGISLGNQIFCRSNKFIGRCHVPPSFKQDSS